MGVARPETVDEALAALAARPGASVVSGGTDWMVAVNAGEVEPVDVVAIRRVRELTGAEADGDGWWLGANLTWAGMEAALAGPIPALAAAGRAVGSRQVRSAGTLGGNLGTASPKASTPPVLVALDGTVELRGPAGSRSVPAVEFVRGPHATVLGAGELIVGVRVPHVTGPQRFLKVGNRSSVIGAVTTVVVVVEPGPRRVRLAVGAAGPRPQRLSTSEEVAAGVVDWDPGRGSALDADGVAAVRAAVEQEVAAVSDHRASARYRRHAAGVLAARGLADAVSPAGHRWGERQPPPRHTGVVADLPAHRSGVMTVDFVDGGTVALTVNGDERQVTGVTAGVSLLDLLRERLDLRGTKDACLQGRCGSCSVLVDGRVVAACLFPAVDAHGASVTTVEGLASEEDGAPVGLARAMLTAGGIQCGFCTPGMVVTASALLAAHPAAGRREVAEEISGNLCRCTGYGRILAAVAAMAQGRSPGPEHGGGASRITAADDPGTVP